MHIQHHSCVTSQIHADKCVPHVARLIPIDHEVAPKSLEHVEGIDAVRMVQELE